MSDPLVAVAYLACDVWVAHCPRPYCRGAEHHGVQDSGIGPVVGGLGATQYVCIQGRCKGVYPARWPDPEMRAGIERLLALRPDWATRSWLPHETLADLMLENAEHGIGLPILEPGRTGTVVAIAGNRIVTGAESLAAAPDLRAIGGA